MSLICEFIGEKDSCFSVFIFMQHKLQLIIVFHTILQGILFTWGLRSIYFGGNMLIVTFLLSGIFYNFVFVAYSSSELSFSKNKLLSVKQWSKWYLLLCIQYGNIYSWVSISVLFSAVLEMSRKIICFCYVSKGTGFTFYAIINPILRWSFHFAESDDVANDINNLCLNRLTAILIENNFLSFKPQIWNSMT